MRVEEFGGWLIGTVMLAVGIAVLASDIDPSILCFKRCDMPKAIQILFGSAFLRALIGLFFAALGLFFIGSLLAGCRRREPQAPGSQQ